MTEFRRFHGVLLDLNHLDNSLFDVGVTARQEIRIRNELAKQKATREQESEEQKLRDLAAKARRSRTNAFAGGRGDREEAEDYRRQDEARAEVMRETLREHRMEKGIT
mmetsp:Transcript_6276/g.6213  ORF Transcript_6276/g.6213 Transcript_6276/m.6213 type:complete len:108 (-) Transcript_6276:9-332(-)